MVITRRSYLHDGRKMRKKRKREPRARREVDGAAGRGERAQRPRGDPRDEEGEAMTSISPSESRRIASRVPQEQARGTRCLRRVSVQDPALVCGRGSPTSAAPTTAGYWGRKAGERSWPAAHGPGEEPKVRARVRAWRPQYRRSPSDVKHSRRAPPMRATFINFEFFKIFGFFRLFKIFRIFVF